MINTLHPTQLFITDYHLSLDNAEHYEMGDIGTKIGPGLGMMKLDMLGVSAVAVEAGVLRLPSLKPTLRIELEPMPSGKH